MLNITKHNHKVTNKARSRRLLGKKKSRLYPSTLILIMYISSVVTALSLLSMVRKSEAKASPEVQTITEYVTVEKTVKEENESTMIHDAVMEFLPKRKSEALMIMHCLAHRENGHNGNPSAHGDGGKAGGPFQFHQPTWEGYRKEMIKAGVATEIGSRYDFKESSRTTAWAIANGRAKAWGPLARHSNGSKYATCQFPSWY